MRHPIYRNAMIILFTFLVKDVLFLIVSDRKFSVLFIIPTWQYKFSKMQQE